VTHAEEHRVGSGNGRRGKARGRSDTLGRPAAGSEALEVHKREDEGCSLEEREIYRFNWGRTTLNSGLSIRDFHAPTPSRNPLRFSSHPQLNCKNKENCPRIFSLFQDSRRSGMNEANGPKTGNPITRLVKKLQ